MWLQAFSRRLHTAERRQVFDATSGVPALRQKDDDTGTGYRRADTPLTGSVLSRYPSNREAVI